MGSLARGKIQACEGSLRGQPVEFMFNPTEYGISKRNSWNLRANKSGNVPQWEFAGGEPRELQVELFFDSFLPRKDAQGRPVKPNDVRKATNQLFNLMMIDSQLESDSPNSRMGAPPKCRITWGGDTKNHFDCYITTCSIRYTMFNENGIPVRATATLALKEASDPQALLPTNPTSVGEPGRRVHVVAEGDRLDWIAYLEYGDARQWRRIAEANHIFDPLDLTVGAVLSIPT